MWTAETPNLYTLIVSLHDASGDTALELVRVMVGFREIRLAFEVDSDAGEDQLATLLRLTERYCVVYQTLRNAPPIAVSLTNGAS